MTVEKVIPILRIFDYKKAIEYYIDWLGCTIDWDHTFEDKNPVYMQISLNEMVLHLSEHHGDSSPGARVYIECAGLKEYHQLLTNKKYKYNRPGLEKSFYETWCMEVIDPFGNRLTFNQKIEEEK
jgi:uncharacterized glyoxalase superfamily protein PhnB